VQFVSLVLAAAEEESQNPVLPATAELIWGAISFFLLLFVVVKLLWPTIEETYRNRAENIEGKLEKAEKEREEASRLLDEYRERLAAAEEETQRIIEEARAAAERLRREIRGKAEDEASRELERARQAIRSERDQAMRDLRREVGTLAVDLAARVVDNSLDRERQLRLIDQYIQELGDHAQAGAMTSRPQQRSGGGDD
jgi:F-type H+-transporting ATPase subunit b